MSDTRRFYFIEKDYQNESLNNMARRVTEYNAAELIKNDYQIIYSKTEPTDGSPFQEIGKIAWQLPYLVTDIHAVNDIFNYNLYFVDNTEHPLNVKEHYGTFDCLVSLASGQMPENNPKSIGLNGNHYVVDISPTAIHKTLGLYKEQRLEIKQLDIFNIEAVKEFLSTCVGTKGFFVVSNCFMYIINALLYDVNLRLKIQNEFIKTLAEDKIDWYVAMVSADGQDFNCIRAKDVMDKQLDKGFKALPWINQQ